MEGYSMSESDWKSRFTRGFIFRQQRAHQDSREKNEMVTATGGSSASSSSASLGRGNTVTPVREAELGSRMVLGKSKAAGSSGADSDEDEFIKKLHFAVWPCDKFDRLEGMLTQRPDMVHARFGAMQDTLLHRASRYGNKKAFNFLLSKGGVLTSRNKKGQTPLHLACQNSRVDMIKEMIALGIPIEESDDPGDKPIHYLAKAGCLEGIELLVEHGARKCVRGFRGNWIIHYAASTGELELVTHLLNNGCSATLTNDLMETPLHLAAKCYTTKPIIAVAEKLLEAGADLNARTISNDTAAHYAGRWGGPAMLEFLLNKGILVNKEPGLIPEDFYEKHGLTEDDREEFQMSLLQKVAKSTCVVKAELVLDRVMDARSKVAKNMYIAHRSMDEQQDEMDNQEKAFLYMTQELNVNAGNEECAIQMFLKYSPESLNRLFDRCVIKCCDEQVQGKVYLDLFLFYPWKKDPFASELAIINTLITSGKERFLIHPIFEIFLKLKWYRTWTYYVLFILCYFTFLAALVGYTLVHFGQFFEGQEKWDFRERNSFWYVLAASHVFIVIVLISKAAQTGGYIKKSVEQSTEKRKWGLIERNLMTALMLAKDFMMPVCVGLVLYGTFSEQTVRYLLSTSVILTSYHFMTVISRLPRIGLYVHMLSKVMWTVLNFFASYMWHFMGYAIAFHILLPSSPAFMCFFDAFIKVLTMLMGEYDYSLTFVQNPESSMMSRIVFVVFVIDMSVVLMNLVLGLAVSDIEELQRNSDVRRMMQETCAVDFMESTFLVLSKAFCFCGELFSKVFSTRITNDRLIMFQDVIYMDLVDLDPNPNNSIILEAFPDKTTVYPCPHSIVTRIGKALTRMISEKRNPAKKQAKDLAKIQQNQKILFSKLNRLLDKFLTEEEQQELELELKMHT